jgi:hypothetical protein
MAITLPYMMSSGTLPKILNKICDASVPETFNGDFLGTKLGFPGGNQRVFISWAKKCDFLNEDGSPTQIYRDFRNSQYQGIAMAKALKIGYTEAYTRNEYAHELGRPEFTKLVTEITGLAHDHGTVKAIAATFFNAKEFADFEAKIEPKEEEPKATKIYAKNEEPDIQNIQKSKKLNLGLNYTINLVLPKTDDPAIYNAIFKSLKENLLDD